ncbi:NAD(P)(+) transhydrogenase [Haloferula helveola]|uniref:Soluble pyridine nucleotide transhydrogenase n=1 Tax=Haloferula helveola TaxID=490095 RepID=A0ABN6H6M4_9BACT|nr:NAD(P)(+) transhydrogenase [Haloferula helveola]
MYDFDLICIGSGPAGQRAAVQASKLGKRVAIIEKQTCIGGVCIETGTIPSKTFREAVRRLYADPGIDHGTPTARKARPSMDQLIAQVDNVVAKESETVQDALSRNDIEVIRGRASFEDPHTLVVDGISSKRRVSGANILIAVGTRPAEPRGIAADGKVVVTSDSLLQLEKLPRKVAVVGAGVIGIEYASMFAALGVQVTIIDKRPRPLEFLDHEIVDELVHQMRKQDVTFRCGDGVSSMEVVEHGGQREGLIELESGKHVVADMILFSVGRQGATDALNLPAAGLEADDRGRLKVNDDHQTSVSHIYAAGDVIGYPALAATSSEQGRLAACHMFGKEAQPMGIHFPIGIYAIPEISMVGKTEEELTAARVPYETGIARFREIARGQILGDDSGMFKMIFHRDEGTLLGVHCIGSGATELIHIGQAVIGLGGGLDYFLNTVFNYPTLAECYKVAAFNAANKIQTVQSLKQRKAAKAEAEAPA